MELVQELFLTAVIAVIFSFVVAKLVSMAMGGGGGGDCVYEKEVTEEIIEKLKVEGFQSEKRVEFVEEVVKTVEIPEFINSENLGQDIVTEEEVELPKKSEVIVEKDDDDDEIVPQFKEEEEEKFVESEFKEGNDDEIVAQFKEEVKAVESELKEENEEVVDIDDDDDEDEDDWEGIERSELEKVFAAAAKFVENVELVSLGSDLQLELYGLHKVATEGPCREPQPMALMVSSRAKWY